MGIKKSFRPLPAYAQVAAHLRDEILHGDLGNTMPGLAALTNGKYHV